MGRDKVQSCMHSDLRRLIYRIRIHHGRNRGKRNALNPPIHRRLQRIPVAVVQKLRLIMTSAVPDRPDHMNDIFARKTIGFCCLHFTSLFEDPRTNTGVFSKKIVSTSPVYIVLRIGKVLINQDRLRSVVMLALVLILSNH